MIESSCGAQAHQNSYSYSIDLLPSELIIQVFTFLSKRECKAARLVSKVWSVLAADRVFDTVYIRPNIESLGSLNAVAQHSYLRNKVTALYVDVRPFKSNLTKQAYLQLLIRQMRLELELLPDLSSKLQLSCSLVNGCRRLLEYAREPCRRSPTESAHEEESLCQLPIVEMGYTKYTSDANEQTRWLQNSTLWTNVHQGLTMMQRIKSIAYNVSWIDYRSSSASHDSRFFHLQPGQTVPIFSWSPLFGLLSILQHSTTTIRTLLLDLDSSQPILRYQNIHLHDSLPILTSIQHLCLNIGPRFSTKLVKPLLDLALVMVKLRTLRVDANSLDHFNDTSYWALQELLFRSVSAWQSISTLHLDHIAIDVRDLFDFLRDHTRLQEITMTHVQVIGAGNSTIIEKGVKFVNSPDGRRIAVEEIHNGFLVSRIDTGLT